MNFNLITTKEFDELIERVQKLEKLVLLNEKENKRPLKGKDVKELLGICDSTLSNYCKRKILNPLKVGGRVYFSQAEVYGLLNKKGQLVAA